MTDFAKLRKEMVESQLMPRGIYDPATLKSMLEVPRHLFVPQHSQNYAYADGPLPIGFQQTISQPYIVALMTQSAQVDKNANVLEIGTGSGYQAAVLSRMVKTVYTVERISELADQAKNTLQELGYNNVFVKVANGTLGWPEKGSFDAIIVTAAGPSVPKSLLSQLLPNGRLIIPIGNQFSQELVRICKKAESDYTEEFLCAVRFVPLIGDEGFAYP